MIVQFQNDEERKARAAMKHALVHELTSPLQRIMSVYNIDEPARRTFENNICAVHVGRGFFLSSATNLRTSAGFYRSIDEDVFRRELFTRLDGSQNRLLDTHYYTDPNTRKRYLNSNDPVNLQAIAAVLKQKRFDTRWAALAQKKICDTCIVFQFRNSEFYNDAELSQYFNDNRRLYDTDACRHTFLLPVTLIAAFYAADIALYRVTDAAAPIINKIPFAEIDYNILDEPNEQLYCLQHAPGGAAGRLLSEAHAEGIMDHVRACTNDVDGHYLLEGLRYLVNGYSRPGSPGAPYLIFDPFRGKYLINAIQSELADTQINTAIASPLFVVKDELQKLLAG